MTTLEINGKRVQVDDSFKSLSPEQQQATVDEIARSMGIGQAEEADRGSLGERLSGQFTRGAAGVIDAVNTINPVPMINRKINENFGTNLVETADAGRALRGLGVPVAENDPETIPEALANGAGNAAAAFGPVVGGLARLRSAGGAIGAAADDALRALTTARGGAAELAAGAVSEGAAEAVEQAGGGETAQNVARLAAPLSIPAITSTSRYTPTGIAIRGGKAVMSAVAPQSRTGAMEVAGRRMQELAGGEDRAMELGERISINDEFGRTPAQQTGDANMLGLEQSVSAENPAVGDRIAEATETSAKALQDAVSAMGGEVGEARAFFRDQIDDAVLGANKDLADAGPSNTAASSSSNVVDRLNESFDQAKNVERQMWSRVPLEVTVAPAQARNVAQTLQIELGRAGASDMPDLAQRLLLDESGYGAEVSAQELHNLYSKMREISRNARAGTQTQDKLARSADMIAEAILKDMDAVEAPTTALGQALTEARTYSREMHETFDTGAVGRVLKRTPAGDEAITPETALRRTVGLGGEAAGASATSIRNAAPDASADVEDYLRSRFSEKVMSAAGEFTPKAARTWLRDNRDVLNQSPKLKADLMRSLQSREDAQMFAMRADLNDFNSGQAGDAIKSIIGADDPIKAARSIATEARKDPTGKALAGVKGSFADYLMDPQRLPAAMQDPKVSAAMTRVFDGGEMRRLREISTAMKRMNAPSRNVGETINTPANRMIEVFTRVQAAKAGTAISAGGNAGVGLQAANLASTTANRMLQGVTNATARKILEDAVTDPALFRELLMSPERFSSLPPGKSRLAPYLTGGASTLEVDE